MSVVKVLIDMATNAPVAGGLAWLRQMEGEQPEQAAQFARLRAPDCTPEEVLETILSSHWFCRTILASVEARANALAYISTLQVFLRLDL